MFTIMRKCYSREDDTQYVKIASIVEEEELEDVYNMEVEDTHCFAINGGYIVHNCRYAIEHKISGGKFVLW